MPTVQRPLRAPGSKGVDQGAGLGCVHREAEEGGTGGVGCRPTEPGYPCLAQRWTGSDDARCVPEPRDAASPVAGRSKCQDGTLNSARSGLPSIGLMIPTQEYGRSALSSTSTPLAAQSDRT